MMGGGTILHEAIRMIAEQLWAGFWAQMPAKKISEKDGNV